MSALRVTWVYRLLASNTRGLGGVVRAYSQYPPYFIKPVYQKEKIQDIIESGEAKEMEFKQIKATYPSQTSSIFHDPLVSKFINYVMKYSQKALARELVEQTFEEIKLIQLQRWNEAKTPEEKAAIECNPNKIFHQAVQNCRPILTLMPVKRGGVKYQVPVPITVKRSHFEGMRWLVAAGREKERTIHFPQKMARELLSASKNEGRAVKKKQSLHQQCETNKAYAHYRWG